MEPRTKGENEGICSVGTASVCGGGDVVDIEIDSGAEVSCLPSNIELTRTHCMRRGSACVEVTTSRLVR